MTTPHSIGTPNIREGYIAITPDGVHPPAPDVNWNEAFDTGQIVGSARPDYQWYMNYRAPMIATAPEQCHVDQWPMQLLKVAIADGAHVIPWSKGRVRASAVRVAEKCAPGLLLGPQHGELQVMAKKVNALRPDQHAALNAFDDDPEVHRIARTTIRGIAEAARRYNTDGVQQFILEGKPEACEPIGNAAIALAHRDLLESSGLWSLYGTVLLAPWEAEMGRSNNQ